MWGNFLILFVGFVPFELVVFVKKFQRSWNSAYTKKVIRRAWCYIICLFLPFFSQDGWNYFLSLNAKKFNAQITKRESGLKKEDNSHSVILWSTVDKCYNTEFLKALSCIRTSWQSKMFAFCHIISEAAWMKTIHWLSLACKSWEQHNFCMGSLLTNSSEEFLPLETIWEMVGEGIQGLHAE